MTGAALLLVVVSAFAHATWNLAAKRAGDGGAPFVFLYSLAGTLLFLPAVVVVLAVTRPAVGPSLLAVTVSGSFHTAYFLTLQRGYATGDLSVVYPLARGTGPVLSVLLALVLLGERPHPLALAGAAAVVLGVFAISGVGRRAAQIGRGSRLPGGAERGPAADRRRDPRPHPPEDERHGLGAVGYGLLTGVFIAGYTLWDAHAVTALAAPPLLMTWGADAVRTVVLAPVAARRRDRTREVWRRHRVPVLAVAGLSPLAYLLVLFAFRLAPVSYVAPARELSVVIGSAFGLFLLGEPQGRRRLLGAAVVVVGVAALALA